MHNYSLETEISTSNKRGQLMYTYEIDYANHYNLTKYPSCKEVKQKSVYAYMIVTNVISNTSSYTKHSVLLTFKPKLRSWLNS